MYAVIKVGGHQFRVQKGQEVFVYRLPEGEGEKVVFDNVLLIENDGKVAVGTPLLEGAGVTATVVQHFRDDKVLVFKKKRRKGYQTLNGHRQYMSKVRIEAIEESGVVKPAAVKKEKKAAPAKAEKKAAAPAGAAMEEVKAAAATGAAKKDEKESAKAAAPKKPASAKKTGAAKKASAKAKDSKKEKK